MPPTAEREPAEAAGRAHAHGRNDASAGWRCGSYRPRQARPEQPKARPMPLLGSAVLAVWNDVDPAIEDDYDEWYLREHIAERTTVPGLARGRRYRADQGSPRYMAFYEAASLDVL